MAAIIAAALTGGSACGSSSGTSKDEPSGWSPDLPLTLEWNLGQADARYQAVGHGAGYHLYLDGAGATVAFGRGTQVTMKLFGAGRPSALEALDVLPGKVNYFLGARPERWITDVPTFRRARYRGVYPGIDVVYYGQGGNMEHDFVVHPARIRHGSDWNSREHPTSGSMQTGIW
ncbi:MAG: hypothetical protein SFV51_06685 [Bryobacteraceae bacterium]|nr:hypothetical protein [Bryobacteraceae bacterium]